jgi:predicted transcriptional regulator
MSDATRGRHAVLLEAVAQHALLEMVRFFTTLILNADESTVIYRGAQS